MTRCRGTRPGPEDAGDTRGGRGGPGAGRPAHAVPRPGGRGSVLPAEWPAKFDELVDHYPGDDDASRRLRVLEKVRRGAGRGGWDAFLLAHTDAVRAALAALRKEVAGDEPDR